MACQAPAAPSLLITPSSCCQACRREAPWGCQGPGWGPDSPPPANSEHFPSSGRNTLLETKVKKGWGPGWESSLASAILSRSPPPALLNKGTIL